MIKVEKNDFENIIIMDGILGEDYRSFFMGLVERSYEGYKFIDNDYIKLLLNSYKIPFKKIKNK